MARYKPEVGDQIKFQKTGGRKQRHVVTQHTGTIDWAASSGRFFRVIDHNCPGIDAFGKPMNIDIMVSADDVLGKVK